MNRSVFNIWFFTSLVWVALIATFAWQSWPYLPLDVSASDPDTQAALNAAVTYHVIKNAIVALLPPAAMFAIAYFVSH